MVAEIMSDIGNMNMTELAKSGPGVKNVGTFVLALAEISPELLTMHLPSVIRQVDSDVYQIR